MKRHRDVDALIRCPPSDDLGPLFDSVKPKLRQSVSTSRKAESRHQARIGSNSRKVMLYLAAHGSATRNELESGTGIRINVICSTVNALQKRGWVWVHDGKHGRDERIRNGGHLMELTAEGRSALEYRGAA